MQIKLPTSIVSCLALLAPIHAVKTPFNASFDDLKASTGLNGVLSPVGIYQNISYSSGFHVAEVGTAGVSVGVIPHSNPNVLDTTVASSISIVYPGSKIKSLALNTFYYGCETALKQGTAEVAVACNITVTGYKAGSTKAVATQDFKFTPAQPASLTNAPTFGTFSSAFQGLQHVNFTFTPATVVGLLIDNLVGSKQS